MEDSIRYALEKEFTYSHAGDTQTATFIELNSPTAKNLKEVGQIRQSLTQAIREHEDRQSDSDEPKAAPAEDTDSDTALLVPDGKDIITVIASSSVDLAGLYACARILLLSKGICQVGGDEKLTQNLWDSMSARDVEMMVGTYIANFIMA